LNEGSTGSAFDSAPQNSDGQWDDSAYVPEREFVLMPLFRRIGEMLGLRKGAAEVVYSYEPESRQQRDEQVAAAVPEPVSVVEDRQVSGDDALARHISVAQTDIAPQPSVEEAQPIETVELESHEAPEQFEAEAQFEPVLHASTEPVQVRTEAPELALPVEILSAQPTLEQTEEPDVREEVPSPLYQEQDETAEQQYVTPMASAPAEQVESPTLPAETATAEVLSDEWRPEPSVTEWEQSEAPALQRERAWRESEQPKQAVAATKVSGPQLVSVSKQKLPPLWKRVDLAKQFTPQRVAVLGAVAMAVLMVLGISVARRPAASMLPQQPQVRSIQPGGVTLTTHQHRSAPVGVRRVQGRTAAPAPGASRPVPRQQSAAGYSEPDVVTHYYQKEKPSPVHQATVAGVRHFSDME
jgi:hypothetical protein